MAAPTGRTPGTPPAPVLSPVDGGHGNRYGGDTKESAYQLWAFRYRRNAERVAGALAGEDGQGPDPSTVQRWAREDEWAKRADAELRALAPALDRADTAEVLIGRGEGIAAMRDAVAGRFDHLPAAAINGRITAARALIEAGGMLGKGEAPTMPADPGEDEPLILDGKTPQELQEVRQRLRAERDGTGRR